MANQHVKLKDDSNYLYPEAVLNGPDFNNILASGGQSLTSDYDGFAIPAIAGANQIRIYIDDIDVYYAYYGANQRDGYGVYQIKKGQTIRTSAGNTEIKIYGIKR